MDQNGKTQQVAIKQNPGLAGPLPGGFTRQFLHLCPRHDQQTDGFFLRVALRLVSPADTYDLRHQVLWPDKPAEYVRLAEDADGYHYGAFEGELLVSVVSLFVTADGARFRKFATHPAYQRHGIGTQLLTHVMAEAVQHGARTISCDARQEATALYQRFGMQQQGPVFYKGPIAYVRMEKALP